jgi:replication factor C subunit 3/5
MSVANQNDFLPWVEKYRPKTIDEIISHDQNIETIKKLLIGGSLPHLLFHGSSGTGKTSTIMALAKEIYGNNMRLMVMKLDASDDRGINSVREDIKGFAEKSNMFQKGVRLIILDEADSMTFDAQFALRRIIEKYSMTIRFCLICNYENKIIPAIRSRCANFRFSNIDINHICIKLNQIVDAENIKYESQVIETIATLANGDLRKAINLIQTISMQTNFITNQLCWETSCVPSNKETNQILEILYNKDNDFDKAHNIVTNIIKCNGYSLSVVLKELLLKIIENEIILVKIPHIISDLSDLENMASKSTFSDIYITSLVGIFKKIEK